MIRDDVLRLLRNSDVPISGEKISAQLGVSRTAIWKVIHQLSSAGYEIESLPSCGYRLLSCPDQLEAALLSDSSRIVGNKVICLSSVDSTNDECKRLSTAYHEDGIAVFADEQTRGKGRQGRSFLSQKKKGLYLSVLLRPHVELSQISQITAWSSVAVCRALEKAAGLSTRIKWPNDILLDGKKLCGILTELNLEGESGELNYVIIGIGLNISQTEEDFGEDLRDKAISLAQAGIKIERSALAECLLQELDRMYMDFPLRSSSYLEEYSQRCITLNREAVLIRGEKKEFCFICAINPDYTLQALFPDGSEKSISSGEVSVRGILGYI